jgi:hypothetical protein
MQLDKPHYTNTIQYGDLEILPVIISSQGNERKSVDVTHETTTNSDSTNGSHFIFNATYDKMKNLKELSKEEPLAATTNLCYICHTPEIPGKFNPQKALQLGLKKGPQFGRLCKGQTVTTVCIVV